MLSENKNAREFGRIDRPVQRAFRTVSVMNAFT
jgi:hypothetical protein